MIVWEMVGDKCKGKKPQLFLLLSAPNFNVGFFLFVFPISLSFSVLEGPGSSSSIIIRNLDLLWLL